MTKRRVFLILAALWLCFIWGQSFLSADLSRAESGRVLALLQRILPGLTAHMVRKAAHFTEYAVLGALLFGAFPQRTRAALTGVLFASLLAAVTDETIQLYSAGRSVQITDVWLDFAGAALGYLAMRLLTHRKE